MVFVASCPAKRPPVHPVPIPGATGLNREWTEDEQAAVGHKINWCFKLFNYYLIICFDYDCADSEFDKAWIRIRTLDMGSSNMMQNPSVTLIASFSILFYKVFKWMCCGGVVSTLQGEYLSHALFSKRNQMRKGTCFLLWCSTRPCMCKLFILERRDDVATEYSSGHPVLWRYCWVFFHGKSNINVNCLFVLIKTKNI